MPYPDNHTGEYDPATGRGSLWRPLTPDETTALRAELAHADYAALSDADAALHLLSRSYTGPATRTVVVAEAARRDVIGAAGGFMFLAALHAAAAVNSQLQPLYDYLMSETAFVPSDLQFQGGLAVLNSIVINPASGAKLLPDSNKAAIIALGFQTQAIPDAERVLGASRAETAGLPDLLITADDIRAARSN